MGDTDDLRPAILYKFLQNLFELFDDFSRIAREFNDFVNLLQLG